MSENQPKEGGPAFPVSPDGGCGQWPGMSLREYFAAAAVQGLSANHQCYHLEVPVIAKLAVQQADALITELNKGKQ